ncbi:hypothetical protein QBC46DRAFT_62608 [Diplogelasinospora grovesii]|uniref:Uncharacterized protein n=1 Tax=Diplogelasinospora grovesii TaxID=303347 RepID=A0AAN6NHH8_9PEZI|nr:hypothetical protein QBC46DRAFT_62608 [Diplogelasinospora grovesii]
MAARSVLSQALEPAKLRSVYLRVKPAPSTLSERRSVLRALKQHGEIEVFKKLHDGSSFISVAAKSGTADMLVTRSPLQYDYVREHAYDSRVPPAYAQLLTPIDVNNLPDNGGIYKGEHIGQGNGGGGGGGGRTKTFTVEIFPAPEYAHKNRIRASPLHGTWPDERGLFKRDSFTTAALRRMIPKDMSSIGLRDWESGGQIEEGSEGGGSMGVNTGVNTVGGDTKVRGGRMIVEGGSRKEGKTVADYVEQRRLRKMQRERLRGIVEGKKDGP